MNKLLLLFLVPLICLSCARRNFSYVDSAKFDSKLTSQFSTSIKDLIEQNTDMQNRRYYMGIALKDTFLGGELTFTQTAEYDYKDTVIQYCYMLFDDQNNVFYDTHASEKITDDTLKPIIPHTIGLDTLTINDAPDALQGKFYVQDGILHMIFESKEQSDFVSIKARLIGQDADAFQIFQVTRKRLTYSPLNSRDNHDGSQKVFDLQQVFSIDLKFVEIPTFEKVQIRRNPLEKRGPKGIFSMNDHRQSASYVPKN
ncbi:hypothetical protein [Portibacter marinus]|uniref:hypothetical protein n=1 Tax=Portibacter marinus TaxID=2898660 RepID=UPI001F2C4B52|nr:hypothetical protein [Portibacter marinus]